MMITKKELCGKWVKYNNEQEQGSDYIVFNRFGQAKLSNFIAGCTLTGNYRINEEGVVVFMKIIFCSKARLRIYMTITGNVLTIDRFNGVEHKYVKCPGHISSVVDWREIGIIFFTLLLTLCIFIAVAAIRYHA